MKMKGIGIILGMAMVLWMAQSGKSQEDGKMRYIFSGEQEINISGMGGPTVGFTSIGDEFAVTAGGQGAVLFNQKFFIGGYGEGVATIHERNYAIYSSFLDDNKIYNDLNMQLGHGGFWLGYIHNPNRAVHLGLSSKFGFGAISLFEGQFHADRAEDFAYDNVFVVNPQIEVELNLLKWMKMNVGFGYQLVAGINKEYKFKDSHGDVVLEKYFDQGDFNKPIGHITFLFGWFTN